MLWVILGIARLRAWSETAPGRKALRYLLVSVFNVALGQAVLGLSYLFLHWSAEEAAVAAVTVATVPAYFLNRLWVWGRTGRSHVLKEVLPFWTLAVCYLLVSVWVAHVAETVATRLSASRTVQTGTIMGILIIVSLALWAIRYLVLDALVFPSPDRLDGRTQKAADARA